MKEIEIKWLIYENGEYYDRPKFWEICPANSIKELKAIAPKIGKECNQHYLEHSDGVKLFKELNLSVPFVPDTFRLRKNEFTLKSGSGYTRNEIEFEISDEVYGKWVQKARDYEVKKHRIKIPIDIGLDKAGVFEVDVYSDRDLIVCELEIPDESLVVEITNRYPMGKDITMDSKYKNKQLAFDHR